jgi:hypothetical protein
MGIAGTDGFERREPIQSLETLGEVVGVEECLDVLAKLVVAVVMVAPNSRLFAGDFQSPVRLHVSREKDKKLHSVDAG